MKNLTIALTLFCSILLSSCSIQEPQRDPDLVSKWELMEELINDGSKSIFKPAERTETVEFLLDSRIKRSTSWCAEAQVNVAEYSTEDKSITVGCGETPLTLRYAIKGDFLFIYPNCFEACALKYRRIDNLVGFVN